MGQSSGGRPVIRPTGARDTAEPPARSEYVRHQQQLAFHALCIGITGAARAALLGLSADDFVDGRTAGEYFEVLRDRSTRADDVLVAIHRLIAQAPADAFHSVRDGAVRPISRLPDQPAPGAGTHRFRVMRARG